MHDDPVTGPMPDAGGRSGALEAPGRAVTAVVPTVGQERSPHDWVCPFIRASDELGALGLPIEVPDPANRCAALAEAVPQSLRQQELVCLAPGHVNCPRYLRGSHGATIPLQPVGSSRTLTTATAGSLAVFALAFLVSIGFVVTNGGLALSAAGPGEAATGAVLGDVSTPPPTPAPTAPATPAPTPTASPTASPSPSPTQSPTPTPTATPTSTPTPKPTATPSPRPTSGRFALLTPCPKAPDCYIYVIRSGDNLYSIAKYFGVSESTVRSMNPWVSNGLTIGRGLRIPTPTR